MKKLVSVFLTLSLILLLPACSGKTVSSEVKYNVVATEHSQYFETDSESLLHDLNANLDEYGLSLSLIRKSDLSALFSENNGETWKVSLSTMGESDAKLSPDTKEWAYYIKELELSLFSDSDADAKRNGQYIRALIRTFTPGAEELVEDALGIYGEPSQDAVIAEGTYRATIGNVSYVYQPGGNRKYDSARLLVQPLDDSLNGNIGIDTPRAVRPNQ